MRNAWVVLWKLRGESLVKMEYSQFVDLLVTSDHDKGSPSEMLGGDFEWRKEAEQQWLCGILRSSRTSKKFSCQAFTREFKFQPYTCCKLLCTCCEFG